MRLSEKRSRLVELNELAKKYYNYVLLNSKIAEKALQYLTDRGFKKETIAKYEVGYSVKNGNISQILPKKEDLNQRSLSIQDFQSRAPAGHWMSMTGSGAG